MEADLTFVYDDQGDILYIQKVPPYPEQESEPLEYNVVARRNPRTRAIEGLEVLFFTRWLLKGRSAAAKNLADLFAESAAA